MGMILIFFISCVIVLTVIANMEDHDERRNKRTDF